MKMKKSIFQNVSSFSVTSWILRTEISPNPASLLDFSWSFEWCVWNKKPQPLLHLFSGLMGRSDLFPGGGGGVFAGSPFSASMTLWIVWIFLPIALLMRRFFYSKLSQKGDMKFSFKKNVFFHIHYTFIVDLIRKFDARKWHLFERL